MKTERLPNVPKGEPGDFYYHHLRLPYANHDARGDIPFEPDPTMDDMMDVSTDEGDQLGFVILRKDQTVEIVDTVTGQHVRIRFRYKRTPRKPGKKGGSSAK
jgi:hypothetical protein